MVLGSNTHADNRGLSDWNSVHGIGPTSSLSTIDDAAPPPLICFSHLRWDFVTQRPQHLMTRFAQNQSVFVWEEHIPCDHPLPFLEHHPFPADNVVALQRREANIRKDRRSSTKQVGGPDRPRPAERNP